MKVGVGDAVRQGPTLVIVRSTTGHTFGGYAVAPWSSARDRVWTTTAGCFLFLVENPHNDAPTCFDCTSTANAMFVGANYGPSFGGGNGYDIDIFPGDDAAQSYTDFPHSYADTLGRGNATFTGACDFTAEDYEVWGVT